MKNNTFSDDSFSAFKISQSDFPTLGIVVGVHGNEQINCGIITQLKEIKITKGTVLLIVANHKAIAKNTRFVEADLNRVFPGKKMGKYEEVLAYHLTPLIKQCDYLVDFHAFEMSSPPFVILPSKTEQTKLLAMASEVSHIVYMPGKKCSLSEQSRAGIGIELGTAKNKSNISKGIRISKKIMSKLGMLKSSVQNSKVSRKYYLSETTYKVPTKFIRSRSISNFHFVRKGQYLGSLNREIIKSKESFYPILLDSPSLGENNLCRIGKRISLI